MTQTWTFFWRRLRNSARTVFARGDFSSLLITCVLMLIPVLALANSLTFAQEFAAQSGGWAVSLSQLIPVALLSVVFGFLLARSHYSELTALLLSSIYSVGVILLIQFFAAPGNVPERIFNIFNRLLTSAEGGVQPGVGFDPYLLVMFLSLLVWFLGHNTAWHVFRLDRVWRAILPPGVVLVLNNIYATEPQYNFDLYLIVYVFLALLLIIRSHIEAREFDWYMNRVMFRGSVRRWFFRLGALLAVALLSLAWLMPTGSAEENAQRFQRFLNEDALTRVLDLLNRLFGSLEGQGVVSTDYYGGDKLTLGGAIQLGEQVVMLVNAPSMPRYYWKSRVFDSYDGREWTAERHAVMENEDPGLVLNHPPSDPQARTEVTQRFAIVMGASRLVYAAPQAVAIRLPVRVEVDYIPNTAQVDPGVLRAVNPLKRGDQYSVVSSVSVASASFLRSTPVDYPQWVAAKNLQLPGNISPRVRDLAFQITANAPTAYDKAKAIETWLRANIAYNESIISPPPDRELVDWVLFEQREAYCTYYASAMIVMLRSLGIPARMGAGFAQGIFDPTQTAYIVRERDAHTWVEVYFPGAGWVEFEPTSAQTVLDRPDPDAIQPTLTPLPTATPTPPPTAPVQSAPPETAPLLAQPTFTSTPDLLSTPTPTATPTEPPPSLLDLPPPARDFLSGLLALAGLIAVLSFAGVGLLWWLEYRGLDRLSPVSRAYARLGIYARWLGLSFREGSTPLERGRRMARELPESGKPVITITDSYITERYAPPRDTTDDQQIGEEKQVESAWRRTRRAVLRRKVQRWLRRG